MADSDNDALIFPSSDERESGSRAKPRSWFLLKLCLILVVYKGSEEMAKTTSKQFVFSWCEHNVLEEAVQKAYNGSNPNNTLSNNETTCGKEAENAAEKLASKWELYFDLLNVVLLFLSVSLFGTMSDYLGRKLFFCLALFGWTVRCGVICVVIYFDLHIAWMLLGYCIDGICGSHFLISMLSFASTADRTNEAHERVLGIAVMEAVLGVGKFTTQFGNGYFIKQYGYFYPMLTSTSGSLLAMCVAVVCLKESSSTRTGVEDHSVSVQPKSNLPSFKTLFQNYICFYTNKENKQDRTIFWICLVAFLLTEFGQDAKSDPLTLYQLGSPFCWRSEMIGWYNTSFILVTYVVGCVVLKLLQRCLADAAICCVGTLSAVAFFAVTGLADNSLWLFLAIAFGLLMVLPKSILKGIASSKAPSDKQGAMFAGLKSAELVIKMVSGPTSLSLYSSTLDFNPGLVFFVFGGIYLLSFLFMVYLGYLLRQQNRYLYRAALGMDTFIEDDDNR